MRKKIVAILLAVCLAVGCLPAPASAAQLTGSREELYDFLKNYWYRLGYHTFNAKEPKPFSSNETLLYSFLCAQPYDDSIYPGENTQRYEPYTWYNEDSGYIKNDNYIPDPEGKCTGEEGTHYTKTNEKKFDWIMENIFNIPPDDISRMKADLPAYYSDRYCYLHNGYYYVIDGADSWVSRNIVIEDVTPKGNLFYVRAADAFGKYFSVMEAKTLDGSIYWTLHYFSSGAPDYVPPGLPNDFDLGWIVLPPDILYAGRCGIASTYTMNHDILTISGAGEIADKFFSGIATKSVVVNEGITTIGIGTFERNWDTERYLSLNDVTISRSVTEIKDRAFFDCRNLTDVYYDGTEEQWKRISIGEQNESLLNATIHFKGQPGNPPSQPTSPLAGSRKEISSFLASIPSDYTSFDAEQAAFFTSGDALHYLPYFINIVYTNMMRDDLIYGKDGVEYFAQYTYDDKPPEHNPNFPYVPDPLHKFDDYGDYGDYKYSSYFKISEAKYNWILKITFDFSGLISRASLSWSQLLVAWNSFTAF